DVVRRRRRWMLAMPHLDPRRLVFIDETWIKTNMAPLRGWGPRGERLKGFAPDGRWHTLTFLAAQGRCADRALCRRWADQRRHLPQLCRANAGAGTAPRRYRRARQSRLSPGASHPTRR